MPAYDYTCTACGRMTEVLHGIHDHGPRSCPSCGSQGTMKKGFATPAVHFKGSGWAKKDRKATSVPGKSKAAPATDAASSEQKTPTPAPDGPSAPSADGGSD